MESDEMNIQKASFSESLVWEESGKICNKAQQFSLVSRKSPRDFIIKILQLRKFPKISLSIYTTVVHWSENTAK